MEKCLVSCQKDAKLKSVVYARAEHYILHLRTELSGSLAMAMVNTLNSWPVLVSRDRDICKMEKQKMTAVVPSNSGSSGQVVIIKLVYDRDQCDRRIGLPGYRCILLVGDRLNS